MKQADHASAVAAGVGIRAGATDSRRMANGGSWTSGRAYQGGRQSRSRIAFVPQKAYEGARAIGGPEGKRVSGIHFETWG